MIKWGVLVTGGNSLGRNGIVSPKMEVNTEEKNEDGEETSQEEKSEEKTETTDSSDSNQE